jgi:hypothetical protein
MSYICIVLTEALDCEQGFPSWRYNVKLWRGCGVGNFQQVQAWRQISVVTTARETADSGRVVATVQCDQTLVAEEHENTFRYLNIN